MSSRCDVCGVPIEDFCDVCEDHALRPEELVEVGCRMAEAHHAIYADIFARRGVLPKSWKVER